MVMYLNNGEKVCLEDEIRKVISNFELERCVYQWIQSKNGVYVPCKVVAGNKVLNFFSGS